VIRKLISIALALLFMQGPILAQGGDPHFPVVHSKSRIAIARWFAIRDIGGLNAFLAQTNDAIELWVNEQEGRNGHTLLHHIVKGESNPPSEDSLRLFERLMLSNPDLDILNLSGESVTALIHSPGREDYLSIARNLKTAEDIIQARIVQRNRLEIPGHGHPEGAPAAPQIGAKGKKPTLVRAWSDYKILAGACLFLTSSIMVYFWYKGVRNFAEQKAAWFKISTKAQLDQFLENHKALWWVTVTDEHNETLLDKIVHQKEAITRDTLLIFEHLVQKSQLVYSTATWSKLKNLIQASGKKELIEIVSGRKTAQNVIIGGA
jgi:hypothetical protein